MRILLPTDSFPPGCGGSGWSTWELARGLRARGHDVRVLLAAPGAAAGTREYDDFDVEVFPVPAPAVPFARNYAKSERLTRRLAPHLADRIRRDRVDVVHAQHVMTGPPSVAAARAVNVPGIVTVRDYWPVCYWSTLIRDADEERLCPECTAGNMRRCLRSRAGLAWPATLPLIPYMRANLARKRASLAGADAVIAVSSTIAADLVARAPELAGTRVEQIPNPVDVRGLRADAARPRPLDGPYAVFAGKLEPNKGASLLLPAMRAARLPWPLVVVGDGRLRLEMEADARAHGQDVRFTGWLSRPEALGWVGHADVLVFPSRGPESLSRVLLEAGALGVPIAAMDTGGTRDIVVHERTGLLAATAGELTEATARLVADRDLAARLGAGARAHVEEQFDAASVVARIESLYGELAGPRRGGRRDV